MNERLGKQQWIDAALRTLAQSGIDAVRVERLAADLRVTKGSFYWHFKDRPALLNAMLAAWQSLATHAIIDEVEAKGGDAVAKLEALFTIVFRSDGKLERGVRAWATQDAAAGAALKSIDRRRLSYVADQMQGTGLSAAESKARARFAYHALIGQFTVSNEIDKNFRLSDYLGVIVPMLVAKPSRHRS